MASKDILRYQHRKVEGKKTVVDIKKKKYIVSSRIKGFSANILIHLQQVEAANSIKMCALKSCHWFTYTQMQAITIK